MWKILKELFGCPLNFVFCFSSNFVFCFSSKYPPKNKIKNLIFFFFLKMCKLESNLDIFLTVLDLQWLRNGIHDVIVLHLYLSSWGPCFYSNVSIDQCRQRGAVLVFTVMDHDYVFENDFAGEAYVDLCNIPGVDGQDISGFDALAITALPLMQPQHKGNTVLNY